MIDIKRFDLATARPAHEDTILAQEVLPASMHPPFGHAYGYLTGGKTMDGHAHDTEEVYIVLSGGGRIAVGEEQSDVGPGDVIAIPPKAWHTLSCPEGGEPLLWVAFWWNL